jgi:hypothetical protein
MRGDWRVPTARAARRGSKQMEQYDARQRPSQEKRQLKTVNCVPAGAQRWGKSENKAETRTPFKMCSLSTLYIAAGGETHR